MRERQDAMRAGKGEDWSVLRRVTAAERAAEVISSAQVSPDRATGARSSGGLYSFLGRLQFSGPVAVLDDSRRSVLAFIGGFVLFTLVSAGVGEVAGR
jgi:hypothetical protein